MYPNQEIEHYQESTGNHIKFTLYYHGFFKMVVEHNTQEKNILQEEGWGANYSPTAAVGHSGIMQFIISILYNTV